MGDHLWLGKLPWRRPRHPGLSPPFVAGWNEYPAKAGGVNNCVIHQPVSVVSQCGAGARLYGLASGNQRRLTGSGRASEACSR